MGEAERIAKHLTPAQKRRLLWLPADGGAHSALTLPAFSYTPLNKLEAAGLVKLHMRWANEQGHGPASSYLIWPTNLGLAVRAIIAKAPPHG